MTISIIVGVGLCSTRQRWFSGRVEPCPYSYLLMRCLPKLIRSNEMKDLNILQKRDISFLNRAKPGKKG